MTENDVLAALIAAVTLIKLTTLGLRHRAAERAAVRKAITTTPPKETTSP